MCDFLSAGLSNDFAKNTNVFNSLARFIAHIEPGKRRLLPGSSKEGDIFSLFNNLKEGAFFQVL